MGFFFDDPESVGEEEALRWSDYVHDAVPIVGRERWLTALVRDPPIDVDFTSENASYQAHLDRIDALRERLRKRPTGRRLESTPVPAPGVSPSRV